MLPLLPGFRAGTALSLLNAMQKLRFSFSKQGFGQEKPWQTLRSQLSLLLFLHVLC